VLELIYNSRLKNYNSLLEIKTSLFNNYFKMFADFSDCKRKKLIKNMFADILI